jgi:hypothetical protein
MGSKFTFMMELVGLVSLCGCGGNVLSADYADYSSFYARSTDRQLLLNLARERNNEAIYFIQLASISSQYQFSTSTGFAPTHTRTDPVSFNGVPLAQNALTLGGTISAGVQQTPLFSFLPLTGSIYAQTIAAPLQETVFDDLYDQGWHADMILRVMAAEIRIKDKNGIITHVYRNDPYDQSYPDFLTFCDIMRYASEDHILLREQGNDSDSASSDAGNRTSGVPGKTDDTKDNAKSDGKSVTVFSGKKAKLSEVVAAVGAHLNVSYDADKGFNVTRPQVTNRWVFRENTYYKPITDEDQANFCRAKLFAKEYFSQNGPTKVEFRFRSFEAVMFCLAKEQVYFQDLAKNSDIPNIRFDDKDRLCAHVTRALLCSDGKTIIDGTHFDVGPILTLTYDKPPKDFLVTAKVHYENQWYLVGDPENGSPWEADNRMAFTVVAYLFSQVAIDTQKLPQQQLIQIVQ